MDGPLRKLAEEHGPLKVWRVGIDIFGYPPTWEPVTSEILKLQKALKG